MNPLRTDYKNDVLKPSMNGKRHYNIVDSDGVTVLYPNVILNDISEYEVRGDKFGKDDINAMNAMANRNRQDNEIIMPKVANIDEQVSSAELFASEANLAKNNAIMYSSYAEEAAEQARISAEKAENFTPENYNEFVSSTIASLLSQNEHLSTLDDEISGIKTENNNQNVHLSTLDTDVNELKKSVGDGKTLVANAITAKGVTTATDATFATMASNIGNIKSNPTLQSKTASLSTSSQTIKPDSGYDGLSQVTVPAISGNAAQGDVLSGKTFNSATAGVGKIGTMANKGGTTVDASAVSSDATYTYLTVPTAGYYNTNSKVRTINSNLMSQFKYFAIVSQCYGLQGGAIAKNNSQYKNINNTLSIELDAFKIEEFKVTAKVSGKFGYLYGKSIGGGTEFNVVTANAGDIIVNKASGNESYADMIMICVFKFD